MGPLEVQGLEVIPRDLLMAKERLKFDRVILKDPPLMDRKYHQLSQYHRSHHRAAEQFQANHHHHREEPRWTSCLQGYSPDTVQLTPQQDDGAVPSESLPPPGGPLVHEPLAHAERATVTRTRERAPLQPRELQGQAAPPELGAGHEPSASSTAPTPVVPGGSRTMATSSCDKEVGPLRQHC